MRVLTGTANDPLLETCICYLQRSVPQAEHARSCFSGIGLERTLRMLLYDLRGELPRVVSCRKLVKLYAVQEDTRICGTAAAYTVEEFKAVLDYETYMVIVADHAQAFHTLFTRIIADLPSARFELITFRPQERSYITLASSEFICYDVHDWQVYQIKPETFLLPIRKPNTHEIHDLPPLNNEASPGRYWEMECYGIPNYSVWVLPSARQEIIAVCSLIPYAEDVQELKLWTPQLIPLSVDLQYRLMCQCASLVGRNRLIWRFKPQVMAPCLVDNMNGIFLCSEEQHLHYRQNRKPLSHADH